MDYITIKGARQHNLKNIDLKIPKNKLVVFTGVSGSGKSSLAFDTIYAEGQRRYVESLSSYARQFLGLMTKPDVDQIDGLSPSISIDQKAGSHNPRSTVGTITEIYDYLRLLFARVGHPHCPNCNREIGQLTAQQITQNMLDSISNSATPTQSRFMILSPVVRDRKGEFSGLFDNLKSKGYQRVRIDNHVYDLGQDFVLIKTNRHNIEVIIDRFSITKKTIRDKVALANVKSRLSRAVEDSLKLSDGFVILSQVKDKSLNFPDKPKKFIDHLYSERFACPECNISLSEIEPKIFSFNSPHGACSKCLGLGSILKIDKDLVIKPDLTINEGALVPLTSALTSDTWFSRLVKTIASEHGFDFSTPFKEFSPEQTEVLLYGTGKKRWEVWGTNRQGRETRIWETFRGVIHQLERRYQETTSNYIRNEISRFMRKEVCQICSGTRLNTQGLSVTINQKNISQITNLPIDQTLNWVQNLSSSNLTQREQTIGEMIIKELTHRLNFLNSVGLSYLTLSREASTLAGGEAQRIRLASQLGTGLTGVLYVLDEPTIGLHAKDNQQLINTLKNLKKLGNTVIVVEHDKNMMLQSDYIIDFGPAAGKQGGTIVASGTPAQIKKHPRSLTGKHLANKKHVKTLLKSLPSSRVSSSLKLTGCQEHNLKNINVDFPLGKLICITGVSGSGKSTLMHQTLYYALADRLLKAVVNRPGKHRALLGTKYISRVSLIDQSPIGKTPRSNPATYTKVFDYIRHIFSASKEAKIRGYLPGRFSFNVKGGRCEACQGDGQVKIEMQFLPDVYVTCEVCDGKRYNSDTLEVEYKNKNISEVLHFTINEAIKFFHSHLTLSKKLKTLQDVGLGYIELGQPAPTLSGGEAQRVKLAKELSIRPTGHNIYLLDEPTTGLHFEDLNNLLYVLKKLVNQNNTVIVIEHNLDIIKNADWIIDLGPEGGQGGGHLVTTGTPLKISKSKKSYTGRYLSQILNSSPTGLPAFGMAGKLILNS